MIQLFDTLSYPELRLLRNGVTPENQTILRILSMIADEFGNNQWRIKRLGQLTLELF